MGAFGTDSRNRTDASATQLGGSDQAIVVYSRGKGSAAAGRDVFKIGKGAKPNFTFTTNVTDGGIFGAGADLLKSALNSQAGLAETKLTGGANLTGKYTTISVVALGLIALAVFYFRRK